VAASTNSSCAPAHDIRFCGGRVPSGERGAGVVNCDPWSVLNRDQIVEGQALVTEILSSGPPGPYALQAAIAAVHADAIESTSTDWGEIVGLYDALARVQPSAVVELNRAAAVTMRDGPAQGAMIDAILRRGDLADYHLAHAARAPSRPHSDSLNRPFSISSSS
jgi:RNA polymerase sigma-70 factor (ECF subfamily)